MVDRCVGSLEQDDNSVSSTGQPTNGRVPMTTLGLEGQVAEVS